MDIASSLAWLEGTSLAVSIRDSWLLFPLLESIHVIGLSLVFGTIAIIDLRLLGLASIQRSFARMASEILTWTWAAFVITAVTGVLMFATNASGYARNNFFRAKLLLLVLAGINMLAFELTARKTIDRWDRARSAPPAGRAVAIISLVVWLGVIVAGRLIGFTTTRATAPDSAPVDVNFDDLFTPPQ